MKSLQETWEGICKEDGNVESKVQEKSLCGNGADLSGVQMMANARDVYRMPRGRRGEAGDVVG